MDFVAFDFETANYRADSACQLAAVKVLQGQVACEQKWLIRPRRNYFSPRNIAIHGIRPADVADAATMEGVWPEFLSLIDGLPLIAHNALFDIGVLAGSLASWDVACPYLEFSCTRSIARRTWPGRARYGLKPLGSWLGVEFQHHDALEDSRCCAKIAMAAAVTMGAASLCELEKQLRLSRGKYSLGRATSPRIIGGRSITPRQTPLFTSEAQKSPTPPHAHMTTRPVGRGQIDASVVIHSSAGSLPLAGKRIVCLGTLRGLSLAETKRLIETLGGMFADQITADVHYVVACGGVLMGEANERVSESHGAPDDSTAGRKCTIRVLSERQFLALLPGGKAAVHW